MSPLIHLARVRLMLDEGRSVDEIVAATSAPEVIVTRMQTELRQRQARQAQSRACARVGKWPPHKEELQRYLADNLSCSQIAERFRSRMPGVTRNAVIGAVHRMKLIPVDASKPRPRKKWHEPRPANSPQRAFNPTPASARVSQADRLRAILTTDECRDIPSDIPVEARVPLQELTDKSCRWPAGDPRSPDFGFCGAARVAGLPYCQLHSRRAFQPPTSPGARRDKVRIRKIEREEVMS